MKSAWLMFVVGAFLCWGSYGPTIHNGQKAIGKPPASAIQVFLCVGVAYFFIAIVLPITTMYYKGYSFSLNKAGIGWGLIAGTVGALGAFCVILSFLNGGNPRYVMPLVFTGAPIINVIITFVTDPPAQGEINPMLYLGFLFAALGAGLILYFKPH